MDGGRGGGGGAWNNRTSPSPRSRPPNVEISSSAVNLMSVIAVLIVAVSGEQIASLCVCVSVDSFFFLSYNKIRYNIELTNFERAGT
jgi:hypothetical protein